MNTDTEALKALMWTLNDMNYCAPEIAYEKMPIWHAKITEAVSVLERMLASQEAEPIAWGVSFRGELANIYSTKAEAERLADFRDKKYGDGEFRKVVPLYSAPPLAEPYVEAELQLARQWLWINHGCDFGALYGDDGEMSCGNCHIDCKRMSIKEITDYIQRLRTEPRPTQQTEGESQSTYWLIEWKQQPEPYTYLHPEPEWLSRDWTIKSIRVEKWTKDTKEAIRFPSKADAEAVIGWLWGHDSSIYAATEHMDV